MDRDPGDETTADHIRITQGYRNVDHVLANQCEDPDCEIHNPLAIEDEGERLTACAFFMAGALAAVTWNFNYFTSELTGHRDFRMEFLGGDRD